MLQIVPKKLKQAIIELITSYKHFSRWCYCCIGYLFTNKVIIKTNFLTKNVVLVLILECHAVQSLTKRKSKVFSKVIRKLD